MKYNYDKTIYNSRCMMNSTHFCERKQIKYSLSLTVHKVLAKWKREKLALLNLDIARNTEKKNCATTFSGFCLVSTLVEIEKNRFVLDYCSTEQDRFVLDTSHEPPFNI